MFLCSFVGILYSFQLVWVDFFFLLFFSLCFDFFKFYFITEVECLFLIFDLFTFALIHQSCLNFRNGTWHRTCRVLSSAIKVLHQLQHTWIPWKCNSTICRSCVVHIERKTQPCKAHSFVSIYDYFHYPWECGIRRRILLFKILVCLK